MQVTKYLSHRLGIWEQENQSKTAQIMNIPLHFIRGTIKTTSTALLSEESSYQKLKGMKHYAVADDHSLLTNDNIINYHYHHYYHYYYYYNHNYNKIFKSDWLSTALISALIGQLNRTVGVMPK